MDDAVRDRGPAPWPRRTERRTRDRASRSLDPWTALWCVLWTGVRRTEGTPLTARVRAEREGGGSERLSAAMGVRPLLETEKLLSLTAVVYPRGDRLGQLLAATSMLPLVLAVSLVTCVLCRRDLHSCFMLLGQLLNELLNKAIKESVREARPQGSPADDFGMPSSHSQFMWYFATYHVLFAHSRAAHHSRLEVLGSSALALLCAGGVAYSRVYLLYHTVEQVLLGGVLGVVCALVWRIATVKWFVPSVFPKLEATAVAGYFHFHDASCVENVFASSAAVARKARDESRSAKNT